MSPIRLILALMLFAAFGTAAPVTAQEAEQGAAPVVAPAISVVSVSRQEVSDRVFASGTVQPVELVAVAPQIEGQQIEALLADVGDRVEAGQVLAELADEALLLQKTQFEASRASAAASIAQAEATLTEARAAADEAVRVRDRTAALKADGNVSQAAADQAVSAAQSALARVAATEQGLAAAKAQQMLVEAQIADIDLRLARTQIKAPVGGIVIERSAQTGAIASAAGQAMFVLIRDGELELQADVAEQDLLRLEAGQSATLRPVGVVADLTGTVRLVEPSVDAITRLGRVRIALDAPDAVRAGLFAEAEILVVLRESLTAPVTAVSTGKEGASVLRVDAEGLVERVPVTTGVRDGGKMEILDGLSEGDLLVARAGAFVRPGDKINPVPLADTPVASN